jgi:hypothetical protein
MRDRVRLARMSSRIRFVLFSWCEGLMDYVAVRAGSMALWLWGGDQELPGSLILFR